MTMIEKKAESIRKEIAKLQKSLARYAGILEKKTAKAEKAGANWTDEEFRQHRDTDMTTAQWDAYFDMVVAQGDYNDTLHRIENAKARLEEVQPKAYAVSAEREENNRVNDMESRFFNHKSREEREKEYQEWLAWFKAECLKDGVVIEYVAGWGMYGTTKSGKRFALNGNSGCTERSRHCYTLYINKELVFTSGDFTTAYAILKR